MPSSNIELLKQVAKRLGPLLHEVVFVGGCTTELFITDEAAAEVRPTFDVDVIAEITSYADYANFSERLRALGFREDTSRGAPLCRWLIDEMKLDVMPIEERILIHRARDCREYRTGRPPRSLALRDLPMRRVATDLPHSTETRLLGVAASMRQLRTVTAPV